MKTIFAQPSNTYTIVLNNHDIANLIANGTLMYSPNRLNNEYVNRNGKTECADGHYLQYHGPQAGTMPVQFVNIVLKKD